MFLAVGVVYFLGVIVFLIWSGKIAKSLPQDEQLKIKEFKSKNTSSWLFVWLMLFLCWGLFPIERTLGMGIFLIIIALYNFKGARKMRLSARVLEVNDHYVLSQKIFFAFKIAVLGVSGVLMFSLGFIQAKKDAAALRRHQPLSGAER